MAKSDQIALTAAISLLMIGGPGIGESTSGPIKLNLDLPFAAASAAEDDDSSPDIIIFDDQWYEGETVVFLCTLGSLGEGCPGNTDPRLRWASALLRRKIETAVSSFTSNIRFAIVIDSAESLRKFPASGGLAPAVPGNKAGSVEFLSSPSTGSSGCPARGLEESLKLAQGPTAGRSLVIYLSDGDLDCPGHDAETYSVELLADVRRWNVRRVPIHALVINPPADESDFPKKLAEENSGKFSVTRLIQ